jgi:Protein of unknown function (DUF2938)
VNHLLRTAAIGIVATGVMDAWGVLREPLFGFPRANYRLIGRWFAYMPRGTFRHTSIAAAPSLPGEHAIGWIAHYAIGISFAAVLVQVGGDSWLERPTLGLALLVGLATLAAPLLVMQPAMGAGIASSKTPNPGAARVQSAVTHLVYALGLYAAGWLNVLLFPPAR